MAIADNVNDAWWIGTPVMARVDVSIVQIYAGATPFWSIGGSQASTANIASWSDGSDGSGIDSWEVFGGVGVRLGPIKLGLSSQFRTFGRPDRDPVAVEPVDGPAESEAEGAA